MSDMQYGSLRERIGVETANRHALYAKFAELHKQAHEAGLAAGNAIVPRGMVVTDTRTGQQWHESEGVCGFGWVAFPDGRHPFVNWAKQQKLGYKGYPKGWWISCHEFNQSMQRKEAYCRAYAEVMKAAGIKCYANSRLD